MIYPLIERIMNGTVTMQVIVTGIEARSFDIAFEKLTHFPNWYKAIDIKKTQEGLSYCIQNFDPLSSIWGYLNNKPLKIV